MPPVRTLVVVAAAGLLAAATGAFVYRQYVHAAPSAMETLPVGLQMSDLDGHTHAFTEWQGKLLLINFWATWCGPCLHEIPELEKLQTQYGARGFQIVGPAVDDPDAVRPALAALTFNYPILSASELGIMLRNMELLGNKLGGLPFSLLVAPDGHIIQRQLGEFAPGELSRLIEANLPSAS